MHKSRIGHGPILILATLLLSASDIIAYNSGTYTFKHCRAAVTDNPNWMRRLVDTTLVTKTYLPGTHDTMAICNGGADNHDGCAGAPIIQDRCQSMSLHQQMDSEIRYEDIRIAYREAEIDGSPFIHFSDCDKDDIDCTFPLYHGPVYLGHSFEAHVMDVINQFLQDNPTGMILMRIKEEEHDVSLFWDASRALLATYYKDTILQNSCWNASTMLVHGTQDCDARGEVLIMTSDFSAAPAGNFFPFIGSKDKLTADTVGEFDYKLTTNWDLYDKWKNAKSPFKEAPEGTADKFYFKGLPGSKGSFPYFVSSGQSHPAVGAPRLSTGRATPGRTSFYPGFPRMSCFIRICTISFEGVNALATSWLRSYYKGQRVGIIVSDFPGKSLMETTIQAIIDKYTDEAISLDALPQNSLLVASLTARMPVGDVGWPMTFDAAGSNDPHGDPLVNPGLHTPTALALAFTQSEEGMNAANALNTNRDELGKATYVYADNQVATMNGAVNDDLEDDEATAAFTILNAALAATVRGDVLDENGIAAIEAKVVDPGVLDTCVVMVEWGDGTEERKSLPTFSSGTQTVTYEHQYLNDLNDGSCAGTSPTYDCTVEVTFMDEDGGVGSNSATETMNNVDPTASIDSVIDELGNQIGVGFKCASFVLVGLPLTGTFSFVDTGMLDTHSAAVDWKDGSTVSFYDFPAITPFTEVHTYATSGVFDVSLTVTNDDTGTAAVSESIEVLESAEAVSRILEALRDLAVVTEEEQELFQNTTAALEGNMKDCSTSATGALDMLLKDNWNAAFMKIGEALTFMELLDDLLKDDDLTACKSFLVLAVKSVVVALFKNFDGKPNFQKRAEFKIGEGDEAALAGSYEGAVINYSEALHSLASD